MNRWARTKRMWRRFVWRFVCAQKQLHAGLVVLCALRAKTKRLKSGVPRGKPGAEQSRLSARLADVASSRAMAQTYHPSPDPTRANPGQGGGRGGRHGSFADRYRPEMAAGTAAIVD